MQQVPEREEIGSNVMSDDELRPSACPMVSRVPSSLQRLHALSNLYAWLRLNLTLPDNLASAKRTLVRKKLLSCCGRGARLFLYRQREPVNVWNGTSKATFFRFSFSI